VETNNLNKRLNSIKKTKEAEYGSFDRNMKSIAKIWSVLLSDNLKTEILPYQVCLMYTAAKLVRATNRFKEDSYIDAQSYLEQARKMHDETDQTKFYKNFSTSYDV
jgi:hypothetical protein